MPANLPPKFHKLSQKLKQTRNPGEKISILKEMLAVTPNHKGTQNVKKHLKKKMAKLREKKPQKPPSKESIYSVQKEGAGQVVIAGPPNSGKSTLLNNLTNAQEKVGNYLFTTKTPQPAMMPYENIQIQLVDTPPLTPEFSPPWIKALLKQSDRILGVFDCSKEKISSNIRFFQEKMKEWEINEEKISFIGNKMDLLDHPQKLKKTSSQYNIRLISCIKEKSLENLREEIFNSLNIIRVYTKAPNRSSPDFEHPFVLEKNSILVDLAEKIHKDLCSSFKYAKLINSKSLKPEIVGKDYILQDEDVIEIHI